MESGLCGAKGDEIEVKKGLDQEFCVLNQEMCN